MTIALMHACQRQTGKVDDQAQFPNSKSAKFH